MLYLISDAFWNFGSDWFPITIYPTVLHRQEAPLSLMPLKMQVAPVLGNGCRVLAHEVEWPARSRGNALLGDILNPNCSSSLAFQWVANDWAKECNKTQRKEKPGKLI